MALSERIGMNLPILDKFFPQRKTAETQGLTAERQARLDAKRLREAALTKVKQVGNINPNFRRTTYRPSTDQDIDVTINISSINPEGSDVVLNGVKTEISEANLFVTHGCPFECTFCSSPVMVNRNGKDGNKPYDRPEMPRILDEIEHVVFDIGADAIHFLDDMAFVTKGHIDDLHSGVKDRDLMGKFIWRGLTRAPVIRRFDDETMNKMRETGVWKIALGVESGNNEMLKQIKKKSNYRRCYYCVQKLSKYGIQAKGFFIFGFPGETEAQMLETRNLIQYLKEFGMTEIAVFQFKPYSGTEAFKDLIQQKPDILDRLTYLRRSGLSNTEKVQFRSEQHDTWLPEDLTVSAIPSGKVQEHVLGALEDFYGTAISSSKVDSSCV